MSLAPGTRLAAPEVIASIGAHFTIRIQPFSRVSK
jgi:hypothetical protein